MNKAEFITELSERTELTKADASRAYEAFVDLVKEELVKGEKVAINGFGTFSVRERAARTGRNPQTGETMEIAASKSVGFKASAPFKKELND